MGKGGQSQNLRRASIEIVLLNVDAVIRYTAHRDSTVGHVRHGTRCVVIGLDTTAIFRVDNLRI